jgi:hypothetical protein
MWFLRCSIACTCRENTFYIERTHFIQRGHILYGENTFCIKRTNSIQRGYIQNHLLFLLLLIIIINGVTVLLNGLRK